VECGGHRSSGHWTKVRTNDYDLSSSLRGLNIALLAAATVAACTQLPSSQQPVQASNPSVTYNYRTDQELLRASPNATTYYDQDQTAPRAATLNTNNADGSKTAVFECVGTSVPAPAPVNPNLSWWPTRTGPGPRRFSVALVEAAC
jgi:hypothetical protein